MWIAIGAGLLLALSQGKTVSIRNSLYEVIWFTEIGQFAVRTKDKHLFVKVGQFGQPAKSVRIRKTNHRNFGVGEAIEVEHPDGSQSIISLFPQLPFVLFHFSIHNNSDEPKRIRSVRPVSILLDCSKPISSLRALGTGGLSTLEEQVGSYMWLAIANPQSRAGFVAGWITAERGSGVIFAQRLGELVRVDAQIDYGNLTLKPNDVTNLEDLVIGYFEDARDGMEAWADTVAKVYGIELPPQPVGYCTWYHAGASNERELKRLAEFAAEHLKPFGFSVIQIDDGWQDGIKKDGPRRNFTRHRPDGPYPSGMKAIGDYIRSLGLTPGLWFMPFAGTYGDPEFKSEWFVKRLDRKPYEVRWGGTCLDMTHPEAREYVRRVVYRIVHEWGYRYLKMDGLWTGSATPLMYVNSDYKDDGMGDAVFYDGTKTNIEAFREGLKLVREVAGRNAFLLGCCAPQNMRSYGGAFGLVDAMRIGPDTGTSLDKLFRGPLFGSRHYHLHGRIWYNDPDVIFVGPRVSLAHAQLLCSWIAVTGQLNISSEPYPDIPPERLDLLKRTIPSHRLKARPIDLFETEPPRFWVVKDNHKNPLHILVGIFNWDDKPLKASISLKKLGLHDDKAYAAFEFWSNKLLPTIKSSLKLNLPPAIVKDSNGKTSAPNSPCCAVFSIRPITDHPQLISTSRHITQGMVDVISERWDGSHNTLVGESELVRNDPYELRILLRSTKGVWRFLDLKLSPRDEKAGVRVTSVKVEPGLLKVCLLSPESRKVMWRIRFSEPKH